MKWLPRATLLALLVGQQVTRWSSFHPLLGVFAWGPSFVAVLVAQVVVLCITARWENDAVEAARRRVGWGLSGFALLLPGAAMPLELAAVVGAFVVFRLSRARVLRFVIPSGLAIIACSTFAAVHPWTLKFRTGLPDFALLYWGLVPVAILLLAYLAFLTRHRRREPAEGLP